MYLIVSLFRGKIFDGNFFEGEAVVIDDILVLNSYFFSRSIITVTRSIWLTIAQRELREVHKGVVCLKGNSGVNILLDLSLDPLKIQLLISQTPLNPGAGNSLGMFTFYI